MNQPRQEPREFLSGKLAQVDVAKIENELRGFWQQVTNREEGITGDIVRAVSFTLILFSTDESTEPQLSDILDDIMSYHPCRAILCFYRQDKPHALDAWVTARCHLMDGKKHVCSEQITICADGAKPEEAASVVSPLVLPDLPVVLWWRSRSLAHPFLDALHKCTRKIIFDSAYQPFAINVLQQAADLVIERADCIWLSDLNWRRLNGWRRSVAEAFDGFPMQPDYLDKVKQVTMQVSSATKEALSAQALLLTGWLSSRLGWHHERDKTTKSSIQFSADNRSITVKYEAAVVDRLGPGCLNSVVIDFVDGRRLTVDLERNAETVLLTAQESETQSKESTRVDQHFSEGVLVGQELELITRDRVFEQSLLIAGEITRVIK